MDRLILRISEVNWGCSVKKTNNYFKENTCVLCKQITKKKQTGSCIIVTGKQVLS